jgi:hypothetical protein
MYSAWCVVCVGHVVVIFRVYVVRVYIRIYIYIYICMYVCVFMCTY